MSSRSSRKARGPEYAAEVRKSAAEMLNRAMQVALYGSLREQKLHEELKKHLQEEKKRWQELRGELLKRSQQDKEKNGLYLFIFIFLFVLLTVFQVKCIGNLILKGAFYLSETAP